MNQPFGIADRFGVLMRRAQDGDREAYGELLTEIVPLLRSWLRRNYRGVRDTEDVVQDILLSLHSARATYDCRRPFLPWLLAIARFRAADWTRREKRRVARETAAELFLETSGADQANTTEMHAGDAEALRAALRKLPDNQRRAIELIKLRELTLREAAVITGMSIGALKVATHRATRKLRLALRSDENS
jgi:RNA polymerase sigma-70 factor (ECF subfamily)